MRVRHKTPTLVSMWMLDVFCCALGCVTLLWLLNTRQAGDEAQATAATAAELDTERAALARLKTELSGLADKLVAADADRRALTGWLSAAQADSVRLGEELDKTRSALALAQAEADATRGSLTVLRDQSDSKDKELAKAKVRLKVAEEDHLQRKQDADVLTRKLKESAAAAEELARLVRERTAERVALEKKMAELQAKLDDTAARLRTARTDQDKTDDKLKTAAARTADLEKQLKDAAATIIDLQADKTRLDADVKKMQRETEARFAGIAMTGRRVIFLVDMSGSMKGVSYEKPDPDKWPTVARTVGKVMRSIPTLQEYQVVMFSAEARWLFGPGEWRKFEGEKTVQEVEAAILKVEPSGGTNMHAAFDLAFSLRKPGGLDTIYLFSDGLPTVGPDLPADADNDDKRSNFLAPRLKDRLRLVLNAPGPAGDPVRIHSIGFFYDSPAVGAFLWGMSRENGGSFVGMSKP